MLSGTCARAAESGGRGRRTPWFHSCCGFRCWARRRGWPGGSISDTTRVRGLAVATNRAHHRVETIQPRGSVAHFAVNNPPSWIVRASLSEWRQPSDESGAEMAISEGNREVVAIQQLNPYGVGLLESSCLHGVPATRNEPPEMCGRITRGPGGQRRSASRR